MKKITVIILVVIMLALAAIPAYAKGGSPTGQGNGAGANAGKGSGTCINTASRDFSGMHTGARPAYSARTPYALSGVISSLDNDKATVTVTVVCGNRLAQPYTSQEVILQTTATTRFLLRNSDGSVTPISFEELQVGQNVSSHGTLVGETWTAWRVTSGALLSCLP